MSNEVKVSKNSTTSGDISYLTDKLEKTKSDSHDIGGGGSVQASLFEVLGWTEILFRTYSNLYRSSSKFINKTIEAFINTDQTAADEIYDA